MRPTSIGERRIGATCVGKSKNAAVDDEHTPNVHVLFAFYSSNTEPGDSTGENIHSGCAQWDHSKQIAGQIHEICAHLLIQVIEFPETPGTADILPTECNDGIIF